MSCDGNQSWWCEDSKRCKTFTTRWDACWHERAGGGGAAAELGGAGLRAPLYYYYYYNQ